MMANIACCLVTSVLLNIVDHRQVSDEVSQTDSMQMVWFIFIVVQGGTLNKTTKKAEPKEGEALEKAPSETR